MESERLEFVLGYLQEYGTGLALGAAVVLPWIIYPLVALIFLGLLKTIGGELSFRSSLGVLVHGFMPGAAAWLLSIPVFLTSQSGRDLAIGPRREDSTCPTCRPSRSLPAPSGSQAQRGE